MLENEYRRDLVDPPEPPTAKRKQQSSILVVDPSPLSLIATAGVMHSQGYSCFCARTADAALQALTMGHQDLVVWDVADDAAAALETMATMRAQPLYHALPFVLIAESRWAGLEKKTESSQAEARCLFKPIDPKSLIAVVDQLLWMPSLVQSHRRRGSKPSQPGWVTL